MKQQRKRYCPEQKVSIVRRHLIEKVTVSDLCDEYAIRPTVFYRWQKELFDNGARAFESKNQSQSAQLTRRLDQAQAKLTRKNEVLAEVMEAYVQLKKNLGEA